MNILDILRKTLGSAPPDGTAPIARGAPPADLSARLGEMIAQHAEYFPTHASVDWLLLVPSQLRSMREPSLATLPEHLSACYRLLVIPSFRPIACVRVQVAASAGTVVRKSWFGEPLSGRGEFQQDTTRALAREELDRLRALVHEVGFWRLPTETDRQGLDGAVWVLEGRDAGAHHLVVRWEPRPADGDAPFVRLCEWMLALEPGGESATGRYSRGQRAVTQADA